jgi:hypothetical protein
MGKRLRIGLAVAVVVVTMVVAAGISNYLGEPHYHGKSLSDWVVAMRDGPNREEARQVVHLIGPDHTPLLLEWLRREDRPTLRGRINNLRPNIERWLILHRIMKPRSITSYFDAKESYRALGLLAFEELGPDGRAAIPTLIEWLGHRDLKTGQVSIEAGSAWLILPHMTPDSIDPLVEALSSRDWQVRLLNVGALGKIGRNAGAATSAIKLCLRDQNIYVRVNACRSLWEIGAKAARIHADFHRGHSHHEYFRCEFQHSRLPDGDSSRLQD